MLEKHLLPFFIDRVNDVEKKFETKVWEYEKQIKGLEKMITKVEGECLEKVGKT